MIDLPKDRTDRFDRGVTQREIVRYILSSVDGINEPKIRDYLKENFDIVGIRGIKLHLEKLESSNIIIKIEQRGGSNRWVFNYSREGSFSRSEYIIQNFIDGHDTTLAERNLIADTFLSEGLQRFLNNLDYYELVKEYIINLISSIGDPKGFLLETIFTSPGFIDGVKHIQQCIHASPSLFCDLITRKQLLLFASTSIYSLLEGDVLTIDPSEIPYIAWCWGGLMVDYFRYPGMVEEIENCLKTRYIDKNCIDEDFTYSILVSYNYYIKSFFCEGYPPINDMRSGIKKLED